MTVADLIARLSKLDPNKRVMLLDSFNGAGDPREINFGPILRSISAENCENCGDCEELGEDTEVYVLGYGCY